MSPDGAEILVVGGGMTGMAAALALHGRGQNVRVLERSAGTPTAGAAVAVEPGLLAAATLLPVDDLPLTHGAAYDIAAWDQLHAWLAGHLDRAHIPIEYGRRVTAVLDADDDGPRSPRRRPRVELVDGDSRPASLLIGADGIHSIIRGIVDPGHPRAEPAGYLVWRGLIEEADLPPGTARPPHDESFSVLWSGPFALGAYVVPGPDGSTAPGRRRLAFAWCDARRFPALTRLDLATVRAADIDGHLADELAATAHRAWPEPWNQAIAYAFESRQAFATPIGQYLPRRLVRGAAALIGDAAHAVTPMTGAGLQNGFEDVLALGRAVERHAATRGALTAYEAERLHPARRLVEQGRAMSRSWLASITP